MSLAGEDQRNSFEQFGEHQVLRFGHLATINGDLGNFLLQYEIPQKWVEPYLCIIVENRPLFRFTIGPVSRGGFQCLEQAIAQVQTLYDPEIAVCYNCSFERVSHLNVRLVDQNQHIEGPIPKGVAWKLYPPRLDINRHEIVIDNDIILNERIPEIDAFLEGTHTLMLEEETRTYGRFARHVPAHLFINSGLYGLPPGFDFEKYVRTHAGPEWEENARGVHAASKTFDEQGLVALILSSQDYRVIPKTSLTNCERRWVHGKGCHFIGLNRNEVHRPFIEYRMSREKLL